MRVALHLEPSDDLEYEIVEQRVILTNAGSGGKTDPFRTIREWSTEADAKAYAEL